MYFVAPALRSLSISSCSDSASCWDFNISLLEMPKAFDLFNSSFNAATLLNCPSTAPVILSTSSPVSSYFEAKSWTISACLPCTSSRSRFPATTSFIKSLSRLAISNIA